MTLSHHIATTENRLDSLREMLSEYLSRYRGFLYLSLAAVFAGGHRF